MDRPTKVGFIGLGNMGQPMAARLLEAGFALTVLDADEKAQQAFVDEYGGNPASSLSALASESDAVITMLPDGHVVRRVVLGEGEEGDDRLLGSMRQGAILIDMSSSSPTGTQALGKILAQHGIFMLDAPVSGGVSRAENGTLAIMVGGDAAVVKGCRPLFEAMGERLFETGALGSGHAMKALNNLVSAAGLIAAAEALLIGHRFGLEPTVMIDILNASTGRNNSTENKFKQHILSRAFNSGFSLDLMVKDLTTAVDLARETRTPAVFSAACRELWAAALSRLENEADHTAVVRWFEEMAEAELGGV
jgi:3-hydroxyisobutyrate dehydrogenase